MPTSSVRFVNQCDVATTFATPANQAFPRFDGLFDRPCCGQATGKPKKCLLQPGLSRESTLWLVDQGIHVIGIDAWTLDRPFSSMAEDFKKTCDGRVIWPAHYAGLTKEYCQIEKLANLDRLPAPFGFYVSCLPVKIKDASEGWCRAVALVPASEPAPSPSN